MNALINVGSLIPFAISLSDAIKGAQNTASSTTVEIGAGIGPNGDSGTFGGAVPAVAIWNEQGARLGQYLPKGDKIAAGTTGTPIVVSQTEGATGQPEYLQLTTVNNDAICITYVSVAGNGVNWNWMGDVGYTCGGDWYPSTAKFGSDNYQPKCTWIDADHSDDLRFIAMSMHMPDFNGDKALVDEYNADNANLCNSKARFMQWGQLDVNPGYNQEPPFFSPPLQYNPDGSDSNIGALFAPGTVNKRDLPSSTNTTSNADNSINAPGHVVISDFKAHTAVEVCGSKTSRGPSFVSTQDGMYCDMSTKTTHPVCSASVTAGCFDVDAKQLVGQKFRRHARDLEAREVFKQYTTHEQWTPSE